MLKKIILIIIVLLAIGSLSAQTLCDSTRNLIWFDLENSPKPNLEDKELEIKLNQVADLTKLINYDADYLYINLIVNCKGEDFNYTLAKHQDGKVQMDTLSSFQQVFLSKMDSLLSWTPGFMVIKERSKQIEKTLDCSVSYIFRINDNKIYILNKKELQKFYKKNYKP